MGETLFAIHSGVRYVVLAAWLVAFAAAMAALGRRGSARFQRTTMLVFIAALDAQVLLGILTLLARPFFPALFGHVIMMLLAAFTAHGFAIAARRTGSAPRPAVTAGGLALTLVLIVGGIMAIGRSVV